MNKRAEFQRNTGRPILRVDNVFVRLLAVGLNYSSNALQSGGSLLKGTAKSLGVTWKVQFVGCRSFPARLSITEGPPGICHCEEPLAIAPQLQLEFEPAQLLAAFFMADNTFIDETDPYTDKEGLEWGYEEGVEWGLLFPEANGEYQSPINLNSREAKYDPSLLEVRLSPNYVVCRDSEVINDGHTIQILLKSKSVLTDGPLLRNHEYELHEVRFHWGKENQRGSEHTVNFKAFPMELHLIHWNSTLFNSIDEALGKKNGIAIIALFVQIGKEHLGLKAVTEILQEIQYKGKLKTIPCFNPNTLLPDPLLRDYWVYEGSLTIPPCCENVTWILFRYPLTISQLQIEEFRRVRSHIKGAELPEGCDGILGDNFRPTQPLSDRIIRAAFQ